MLNSAASRDGAGRGLEWGWGEDQGLDGEMQHLPGTEPTTPSLSPHPTPAKSTLGAPMNTPGAPSNTSETSREQNPKSSKGITG